MSPELGHFALALSCVLAAAQFVLPLIGIRKRDRTLLHMAPALALGQAVAILYAFGCLVHASVTDDFSVLNVAQNSAVSKPLLYKIAGVWGNHEGSILLWITILALCGCAVAAGGRTLPLFLRTRVLAILGGVSSGFNLFCLLASNPFVRLDPAPLDGHGMNPLLQDPGLAFHPPVLYAGYVGFAVPFAFSLAALMEGRMDAIWGRWVRPWAVGAWCFLTCGIVIGSWWSYYVLGWGGYWFWDPVENASLLPWLTGTALVHSAIVVEKRESLKIWTILLAIGTFSLSLSGTFLVRSGILNSVHAFASDPTRGVFILLLLALNCGGALLLFGLRAPRFSSVGFFAPISREGFLLLNNLLLCALCTIVLTGTLYPPFLALLADRSISVGKPFFVQTTAPIVIMLCLVMGIGPLCAWKRARLYPLVRSLAAPAVFCVLAALTGWALTRELLPCASIGAALWLGGCVMADLAGKAGFARCSPLRAARRLMKMPRSVWGALLAHLGVAISVMGVSVMAFSPHKVVELQVGESTTLAGHVWRLAAVTERKESNYDAQVATVEVYSPGHAAAIMQPSRRLFYNPRQVTTNIAIHTNFLRDIYVVLGEEHKDGPGPASYVLRLHYNLLAPWIWLGGLMMAVGGVLSLSERRLRIGLPKTSGRREGKPA